MIRHMLKIIWNERRINVWLMLEYILVFCILWFCFDFLYTTARTYLEPIGFDIEHVYRIEMGKKEGDAAVELPPEMTEAALGTTLLERLQRYPAIEAVGFSTNSGPHTLSWSTNDYLIESDSIATTMTVRRVSSGFFDVFRIPVVRGKIFDWPGDSKKNEWLVYPDRNGFIGEHPIEEVHTVTSRDKKTKTTVIGYTPKIKRNYFDPYRQGYFQSLEIGWGNVSYTEISVRVHPNADRDFPAQFRKDMTEQLNIGNYYLASVTPFSEMKKAAAYNAGETGKLNSVFAITAFLIVNIFLGILGSFWFRTQSRRSEIGLRIALGASKRKVKGLLLGETLLLLSLAAVVGTLISLHIGSTGLIADFGIPYTSRKEMGIGSEQYYINFGLTFAFLAIVSAVAVWYPARQASETQPAEALHEE